MLFRGRAKIISKRFRVCWIHRPWWAREQRIHYNHSNSFRWWSSLLLLSRKWIGEWIFKFLHTPYKFNKQTRKRKKTPKCRHTSHRKKVNTTRDRGRSQDNESHQSPRVVKKSHAVSGHTQRPVDISPQVANPRVTVAVMLQANGPTHVGATTLMLNQIIHNCSRFNFKQWLFFLLSGTFVATLKLTGLTSRAWRTIKMQLVRI